MEVIIPVFSGYAIGRDDVTPIAKGTGRFCPMFSHDLSITI